MGIVLISAYFASLSPLALFRALPGSIAQGLIWGLLALGVYITYKLLDFAVCRWTVFCNGGAVAVMLIRSDMNPWISLIFAFAAGMLAGMVTGLLHTKLGNSSNSCRNFNADCTVLHQSEYYGTVQSGDQCG